MSSIKVKIQTDLKQAQKQRDAVAIGALRLLLSDFHNSEIQKKKELSDEEAMAIVSASVKRHDDSISQFRTAGREDLAQKEEQELGLLRTYLPPAIPDSELRQLVAQTAASLKSSGGSPNFGDLMKIIMPKIKGRAAGAQIADLVKEELKK